MSRLTRSGRAAAGASRTARTLLLVLALLLLLAPALAMAADPLIPGRPTGVRAYGVPAPLYEDDRFPPYAYTFEGDSQNTSIGHQPIYFWMNELLTAKAWMLKLSLRTVEYALVQDFLTPFLDRATQATMALRGILWDGSSPLVAGALSLTGIWAVLLYLRGRASRVWASLGGSILVVMVTAALLTAGPGWVQIANSASRDLSAQVYGAMDSLGRAGRGTWGLAPNAGDALWRTLVYQPWVDGEFGSTAGAQLYGQLDANSFLNKSLAERHQICDVRTQLDAYCPWWSDDYLPRRMLLSGWTFLATAVVSGTLAALAGGMILAQLALLFLLMLFPVWLLLALWWPEQGRRLLSALWLRALGALVTQVVLAVMLGAHMLLSLTVSTAFPDGWMLQSLLLTGLGIVAFRYRTAWLEPLAAAPHWLAERTGGTGRGVANSQAARGSQDHSSTLLPAFAAIAPAAFPGSAGDLWATRAPDPAQPSAQAVASSGGAARPNRDQLPVAPGLHLALFRSEMQVLREQLTVTERVSVREAIDRTGRPPAGPAPEAMVAAARQRPAAVQGHISDVTQIPSQRPRG